MNLLDFLHELLDVFIKCKRDNHKAIIDDLLKKQDALVDKLKLYQKRFGKIYLSPAEKAAEES